MSGEKVNLSKALIDLRNELALVQAEGAENSIKFEIQDVTLDLQIVAEASGEAGVEAGWWIFTGKAGVAASEALTHKLSLKLKVVEEGGNNAPLRIKGKGKAPK